MQLPDEVFDKFKAELATAKSLEDLIGPGGAIKNIMGASIQAMLDAELTHHLGYEKHSVKGINSGNSRNGSYPKSVSSSSGDISLNIPRDRNGLFEPTIVKKHESRLGELEDKIIALYAKGMTTRDIQAFVEQLYGVSISPTLVSNITDKIQSLAIEWQNRTLEPVYPIVFFDAIYYKVKDESTHRVLSKAAYTCLAIDVQGRKDILGTWVGLTEGASFWLSVLTELKNRGVQNICIACVDGLKGFPETISSVFPSAEVQLCIVHQIRNSVKYVPSKDQKEFTKDLRTVYAAPTEQAALSNLSLLEERWAKYTLAIKPWRAKWGHLAVFYKYPPELRKMIYTTNAVEALHRQFRKVTKNKSVFPHDDALLKMLFLAGRDISEKWTRPVHNWTLSIAHLSVIFNNELKDFI